LTIDWEVVELVALVLLVPLFKEAKVLLDTVEVPLAENQATKMFNPLMLVIVVQFMHYIATSLAVAFAE
jgi:hypothetical protein